MFRTVFPLLFVLCLLVPAAANARSYDRGFGPQFGFSNDPGQVLLGGHLAFGDIAPRIDFVPGIELGVGDDITVVAADADFHYRFQVSGSSWEPYVGAGVSVFSASGGSGSFSGHSDSVGGGSLIVGAGVPTLHGSRFFAELRLALGDGPPLRALAGWTFPMR